MVAEILAFVAYLVESCTGVTLIEAYYQNNTIQSTDTQDSTANNDHMNQLADFMLFDPNDTIFREHDPPEHLEEEPKAWKLNLPAFKKSFWECLKSVLIIQTVAGTLMGFIAIVMVFLDFSTVEWCFHHQWKTIPKNVQHLKVTAECVEAFIIQLWDFSFLVTVFPFSLIKDLNLLAINLLASFLDVVYRLNLQMYGLSRQTSWTGYPLNILFASIVFINHFLLSRRFHPRSFSKTMQLFFVLSAQFLLGMPVAFFLVYRLFPLYVKQKEKFKVLIAAACPLFSAIPKGISRLGAQKLNGVIHPGAGYVLAVVIYGTSAVVFRVMQAELNSFGLFIALGIVHAIIDLLERLTITMRDHIWEYLYRLVRRQRSRPPKYRSPRSRRLIADLSIQIMMHESSALITALGFITLYQLMYSKPKPFISVSLILEFLLRAVIGLSIDLVFNVISLLIQTRVMNIAVNRVWKKKWRCHMLVNALIVWFAVLYFSQHLFDVVKINHERHHQSLPKYNCSFPSFL